MKHNNTPDQILQSFINDDIDYIRDYQEELLDIISIYLKQLNTGKIDEGTRSMFECIDSIRELLRNIVHSVAPYPVERRKSAKEIFETFALCKMNNEDAEDAAHTLSSISDSLMDMTFIALENYKELSGSDQEKQLRRDNIQAFSKEVHVLIKSLKAYYLGLQYATPESKIQLTEKEAVNMLEPTLI